MTIRINPHLIRRASGKKSRFETDPELSAWLQKVDRYYTIKELRLMLADKFGAARVPSWSSIHRYLQKLTKEAKIYQEENQ